MSTQVRKFKYFMVTFTQFNTKQHKALLKFIGKDQLLALREVTVNLLRGNIPISDKQKQNLKVYKKFLYCLATKSVNRSELAKKVKVIASLLDIVRPMMDTL